MYLDIPQLKRCCCCLPLRRGIITLAYINLFYTLTVITYGSVEYNLNRYVYRFSNRGVPLILRGSIFTVNAELLFAVYALDAILLIVFLIGAHKKKVIPMKIFYYYGMITTLVTLIVDLCLFSRFAWMNKMEALIMILGIGLESYMLLLVRSEIHKLEKDDAIQYVNQLSDVTVSDNRADTASLGVVTEDEMDTIKENIYDRVYLNTVS